MPSREAIEALVYRLGGVHLLAELQKLYEQELPPPAPSAVDSSGLTLTIIDDQPCVRYPKGAPLPVDFPASYRTAPPNAITAERVAIFNNLLAGGK